MKKGISFPVANFTEFRIKMLNWVNRFNIFCLLDNQQYPSSTLSFECLLGAGCARSIEVFSGKAFDALQEFYKTGGNEWLFGHFGYDLKNETEQLHSVHFDGILFSDLFFFVPEIVLQLHMHEVIIFSSTDAEKIFADISSCPITQDSGSPNIFFIRNRISKNEYITTVQKLQQHILRGDCYEINFCQEFFAENTVLDPINLYSRLMAVSPNPFAALYKIEDKYCLCASPERFLQKSDRKISSQPIKGTAKRNLHNKQQDEQLKQQLLQSNKEKSENVMVVDLVRNDLSKVCKQGTVTVEELFGLYSFPQVHQMISTISGELSDEYNWIDAIKATFPMGSMTGVPKKRVMELIEQYERTKRGLFSGAIGYVKPNGDFDFNVVIRSILYNARQKYLSFQTGSAITFYSNAGEEYEECLLKAEAMLKVLG